MKCGTPRHVVFTLYVRIRSTEESLQHILLDCPEYANTRLNLVQKFKSAKNEDIRKLAMFALQQPPAFLMQFLLDASALPVTRNLISTVGEEILLPLFSLTRTWCYALHRERLTLLRKKKSKWWTSCTNAYLNRPLRSCLAKNTPLTILTICVVIKSLYGCTWI